MLNYQCYKICNFTKSKLIQYFGSTVNLYMVMVQLPSHIRLLQPHGLQPTRPFCPWDSPGKNTGMGCHFLLQGIFQTQESNPGLLHCRQILSQLSYKGSPIELLSLEKPELIARSRVAKISGEIGGHLHIFTDLEGFYRTLVKLPLNQQCTNGGGVLLSGKGVGCGKVMAK